MGKPTRNFDFLKSENERKEFNKHIKREDVLKDAKKRISNQKPLKEREPNSYYDAQKAKETGKFIPDNPRYKVNKRKLDISDRRSR